MTSILEQAPRKTRRELIASAVQLYKSGAEPSTPVAREHYTRAELRQAARAFGWRGTKAKRQNLERGLAAVRQAVLVDDALVMAKDRVEHPVKSRLRRS